jgi:hypothetical protein
MGFELGEQGAADDVEAALLSLIGRAQRNGVNQGLALCLPLFCP